MIEQLETKTRPEEVRQPEDLPWGRRFLPAKFFAPKVVNNRTAKLTTLPAKPPLTSYSMAVMRKLSNKRTSHIMLHKKVSDHSFYFKCPCADIELHIEYHRLKTATATVRGSEWVTVRLGTENVTLNRAELRAAFLHLESC